MNQLADEQIRYLVRGLAELDRYADVILIDTGAGISNQVMEFVMASPEVLVVTTPEPSSLTDSYSLLKALYHNPLFSREQTDIRIVSNRVISSEEGQQVYEKAEFCGRTVSGWFCKLSWNDPAGSHARTFGKTAETCFVECTVGEVGKSV